MTSDQGGNRFGNRSEQVPTPDGNSWGCIGGNSPLAQADDDLLATFGYHRPSWQLDALCRRVPQPAVASVERPANRAGAAGLRTLRRTRRVASPGRWPTRHCSACSVAPVPNQTQPAQARRQEADVNAENFALEISGGRVGTPVLDAQGVPALPPGSTLHDARVFIPPAPSGFGTLARPTRAPGPHPSARGRRFPTPSRLAVCTSLGLSDPPPWAFS